jgi:hypothetical protein
MFEKPEVACHDDGSAVGSSDAGGPMLMVREEQKMATEPL